MTISKKILGLWFMAFAFSAMAMDSQNLSYSANNNIPHENQIRLVFMGRTGAGKSTLINAFYNFALKVRWNDLPKHFPIETKFQSCTVKEYQARKTEDHSHGQFASITQRPSEYVSQANNFVLSLIDCPGGADTRGIEQDQANIITIAEYLVTLGNFDALCLVLPVTTNRDTIEAKYYVEEIKSIIPRDAHSRIFVCVTYASTECENIKDFVQLSGLATNTIFYFDNYGLSKDGYGIDTTLAHSADGDDIQGPFDNPDSALADQRHKNIVAARKTKESWLSSNQEFTRLLKNTKSLGKYYAGDTNLIAFNKKIIAKYLKNLVENSILLEACQGDYNRARQEYENAKSKYQTTETRIQSNLDEFRLRDKQLQLVLYTASTSHVRSEVAYCESLVKVATTLNNDLESQRHDKDTKERHLDQVAAQLKMLMFNPEYWEGYILDSFKLLDRLSMSGINSRILDYYEVCIRKEQDATKRNNLVRESGILKALYQQCQSEMTHDRL